MPSASGWKARVPAWARAYREAVAAQLRAWARDSGHAVTEWDQAPVYEA